MGINKRGLGAALTTLGGVIGRNQAQAEEQRRREEIEAKEERRLLIAEKDAEQRQEMNRIKINMEKAKRNNEMMTKALVASEFDPAVAAKAWTTYGGDSLGFELDEVNSPKNADGGYDKISFNMFTYENKGGGVSGVGGVPTKQPLGDGMTKEFISDQDGTAHEKMIRFSSEIQNPNLVFARIEAGKTAEQQQALATKSQKAKAATTEGTAKGKRSAKEQDLDIKLKQKALDQTPGAGKPKGGSVIKGFKGEDVTISKEKSQTLRTALPIVAKKYSDVNTDNDVWKIDQVRNNKTIRDNMNKNIKAVLDGDISDAELVQASRDELGISGEFVQELIDTARANQEAWEEDLASKTPNLLQRTINKITGASFGTGK